MKLELGKSYRNREGDITSIVRIDSDAHYPYRCRMGNSYTMTGNYYRDLAEHKYDLIEEVQHNQEEEEMKHTFTMRCTLVLSIKSGEPTLEVYPVDQGWRQEAEVTVLDDVFELVLSSSQVERLLLNKLNKEVTRTKQAYELALDAVEGAHEFMRNL